MMDFFNTICSIIEEGIKNNNKIAIFPMGKNGTYASSILKTRYGLEGIQIDNNVSKINPSVITQDDFLEKYANGNVTLIVTFEDHYLNRYYCKLFRKENFLGTIRSILEIPVSKDDKKKDFFCEIKNQLKIKKVIGYDLVRVGAMHDGGYVMLDDFAPGYSVYSFGVGNDMSWDEYLAQRELRVYCYDPTVLGAKTAMRNIFFNKIGISGIDNENESMLSIDTILNNNNEMCNDIILKMDVEGAEWQFIENVSASTLKRFRQITFELHDLTNMEKSNSILNCLKKINTTHQPIWIHANNGGGIEFAGGVGVPPLLEVTYVNKEAYKFENVKYDAPIDLDAPNVKRYFDVDLIGWGSAE